MRRICFAAILACLFLFASGQAIADGIAERRLLFFYAPGCHNCERVREKVEELVESSFRGRAAIEYVNIADIENYKLLVNLQEEAGHSGRTVFPVLYFERRFLDGNKSPAELASDIEGLLKLGSGRLAKAAVQRPPTDLAAHFKKLGPLVVMSAGLADGINPCAFSAIVFFISFLTVQGYSKKRIAISGLAFIIASFITYLLIGLGLLGSIYALKHFLAVVRILNISIGVLSLGFGAFSLYDAVYFAKTGSADGLILRLSSSLKYRIQSVIGKEYRRSDRTKAMEKKGLVAILVSACAIGAVVSVFESACTGQVYLPTIMFVLNTAGENFLAFGYLILYNVMFSIPLCVIFLCAFAGVTSQNFEHFMRTNMVRIKIGLAIVFFALGALLIAWYAPPLKAEVSRPAGPAPTTQVQPVQAQQQPKLVPDEYFWDFGVAREGALLTHRFTIKNDTAQKFTVKQINTSCSCTTSKLDKWTLEPGESTVIDVTFDTKGYPGERYRFIYLHTDRITNPMIMLQVRAEIK